MSLKYQQHKINFKNDLTSAKVNSCFFQKTGIIWRKKAEYLKLKAWF
jgi:hypothetical protein